MANVTLSSTASIGLSATAFRPRVIRALTTLASVYEGYPIYAYVLTPASIGLTVGPVATQVNRCLQSRTSTYNYSTSSYVYTPIYISLGINGPSSIPILRTLTSVASFGLNGVLFAPSMVRSLGTQTSIGLTGPSRININHAMSSLASLGLTGTAPSGRLATLRSLGSIGITAQVGSTGYVRALKTLASIGLSGPTALNVRRTLNTLASLGLSGKVSLIVMPTNIGPNVIILFEATDSQNPATYAAILPRDYHKVTLDQTVDSYPQPFTLLN